MATYEEWRRAKKDWLSGSGQFTPPADRSDENNKIMRTFNTANAWERYEQNLRDIKRKTLTDCAHSFVQFIDGMYQCSECNSSFAEHPADGYDPTTQVPSINELMDACADGNLSTENLAAIAQKHPDVREVHDLDEGRIRVVLKKGGSRELPNEAPEYIVASGVYVNQASSFANFAKPLARAVYPASIADEMFSIVAGGTL